MDLGTVGILLKIPSLENIPFKGSHANSYFVYLRNKIASEVIGLQSDSNMEPLNQNASEQHITEE
jgi:hypothetical protein